MPGAKVIIAALSFLFLKQVNPPFPVFDASMKHIGDIPLPAGFVRIPVERGSFGAYLRNLPLRKDKTVYLYNGQPKANQLQHYAVVDVSTGHKDLQQCADAVMRLRAEYFFAKGSYDSIVFGKKPDAVFRYTAFAKRGSENNRRTFLEFMEKVFVNCGTYTLESQLKHTGIGTMNPGDVLVKGGAPGHAEIVADMAVDPKTGKKVFMLVESYMPAQDIHVLLNPLAATESPWYELNENEKLITASWIFTKNQLMRW